MPVMRTLRCPPRPGRCSVNAARDIFTHRDDAAGRAGARCARCEESLTPVDLCHGAAGRIKLSNMFTGHLDCARGKRSRCRHNVSRRSSHARPLVARTRTRVMQQCAQCASPVLRGRAEQTRGPRLCAAGRVKCFGASRRRGRGCHANDPEEGARRRGLKRWRQEAGLGRGVGSLEDEETMARTKGCQRINS